MKPANAIRPRERANARLAVQKRCLPFRQLHRHETHRRPGRRLADGFGVGLVGLAALHMGLDVRRRHDADLMAERRQLPRPEMRPRAGLHPDEAGITMRKEVQNLAAAELALQHDRALRVDSVDLKDVLGIARQSG